MNITEQFQQVVNASDKSLLREFSANYFKQHYADAERLPQHEFKTLVFFRIDKPIGLSDLFKVPFNELEHLLNFPDYKHYFISKKKGGKRELFAPSYDLKNCQRILNYYLQCYYLCVKPAEVHGFVLHPEYMPFASNIVENAKMHTQKKVVLNIDLKDFFPSISAKRVKELFLSNHFQFDEQMAYALTLLTTYKGKLPIGAPTSPVISNFICLEFDKEMKLFCEANDLTYSRYADDLTFSSHASISNETIESIKQIIASHQFVVNEKKFRVKTANRKQTVTGLTVNDKVNVDRKLLKKVRAMLHDLTTNGIEIATQHHFKTSSSNTHYYHSIFIHRLGGYINFIGQIKGPLDYNFIKLKMTFLTYTRGHGLG